ncbi:CD209 antigen-like protein C [Astyanax mexicanus]|uniref:Zgc:174904 n=1 Tax=Astyanax mexicanus TaxID=7994 RepID=A0A3B1JTH0_ASTMX|nr:CD209 antigen-like protein C [Astyanax mexicanus]
MSTEEGSHSTEGMYSRLVEDGGTGADEEFGAQPAPSSTGVRGRLAHHGPYKVATACLTAFCLILLMALVAISVHYNRRDTASMDQNSLKEKNRELQNEIDQLKTKLEKLETTPTPQPVQCTDDWLYFNGSCYFISMFSHRWMESQKYCEDKGGHLAIIETDEEQTFLWDKLPRGHWNSYWFGISDEKVEGDWYWVDGTKLVRGFWEDGEPNNHVNEDCAYIVKTKVLSRVAFKSWYDAPCSMSIPWICERKAAK